MAAQYPGAMWRAAHANNFHAGRNANVDRIVIHVTDGPATQPMQTAGWFANPNAGVSAHFIVGRSGDVFQCVELEHKANHAGPANNRSVGIEHVVPHHLHPKSVTHQQYARSAHLVRWLCTRFKLPLNRTTIVGHAEADPGTGHKSCPTLAWDWAEFQSYLNFNTMVRELTQGRF